ncbi:MAG TPA: helix-turn-helix domain-containing protein [Roseiflexaceae bacterium]|nr:helix-turn-helix domain-containing protein [Roseiflexaceae bacterium]
MSDAPLQGHDESVEQLTSMGLTRYEAAAYLALLGRQGFTPAQVATRAGIPRQRIYDVLASLAARGLCIERHGSQRSYHAVDPSTALPALLEEQRRARAAEEQRQQQQVSALISALAPAFHAGSDVVDPLDYVDVLLEPRRVTERALALARAAERDVLVCFRRPLISSPEDNFEEVRDPLRRGVRYRALYERALLEDPELHRWVRLFIAWGQEARTVEQLPLKTNLYDSRVTLLTLQDPLTGKPSFTALCISHPDITRMLTIAFEGLWAAGKPVE